MPRAVALLVVPGQLVPPDLAGLVVGRLDTGDDPDIGPIGGGDLVDVESRRRILNDQSIGEHGVEPFAGQRIDPVVVGTYTRKVDVGSDHREERERVLREDRPGFRSRNDIVRDRRDRLRMGRGGPDACERVDLHHDLPYSGA